MWPLDICSIGSWLIVSPTPGCLGMGAFWDGLMWPLGICSIIGSQLIVSPTRFEHWRVPAPWFALSHLHPPLIHSPNPPQQVSAIPSLMSNPHLASRVDLAWFVCTMVCFIPSPPAISFTHPFHPNRSQTVLHLHQVLTLHLTV